MTHSTPSHAERSSTYLILLICIDSTTALIDGVTSHLSYTDHQWISELYRLELLLLVWRETGLGWEGRLRCRVARTRDDGGWYRGCR